MRWMSVFAALVLAVSVFSACDANPQLDGPCEQTCDCDRTDAPVRCPGEWTCNADKFCEYVCQNPCEGQVYTCPDGTDCNGSFCSERSVLQCE